MLTSLSKRTDSDFSKVVGVPRHALYNLEEKWEKKNDRKHPGPQPVLGVPAQVLTYLLYLRQYTTPLFTAVFMDVSKTTIQETLKLLEPFFFELLAPLIQFGTYEERLQEAFHYYNELITYICDGTVQECHGSADLALEGNLFSGKNHIHGINILIFCNPHKRLIGMTPCIYGCVKDDDLLIHTTKDWVPKLTEKDRGFGDAGFRVS